MVDKRLSDDRFYEAVREGVHDAIWQMITNNTITPCADFFQAIQDAVHDAVSENMLTGKAIGKAFTMADDTPDAPD